jgi:esterase/lipase superfamily enzyme
MYIITNRDVAEKGNDLGIFGKKPNINGSNELRLVKMDKDGHFNLYEDKLEQSKVLDLKEEFKLNINEHDDYYASLDVACEIFREARAKNKQILVFVHGYNNDMDDIVKTAKALEKTYKKSIIVIFSWPANGGGVLSGTLSYLSDKRDAIQSTGALNNFLDKLDGYHKLITQGQNKKIIAEYKKALSENPENAKAKYVDSIKEECKTTINLLCHSMGNYVLKYATIPSTRALDKPIFDNVCLVAADVNNKDHKYWVRKIEVKNRLYIVINEKDSALGASRIKPGESQLKRLGHYPKSLNAENTTYINITNADNLNREHSYFKGKPVKKNIKLNKLFLGMFHGKVVEDKLLYQASTNSYVLK